MCNGNFTSSRYEPRSCAEAVQFSEGCSFSSEKVVRLAGLEPARVTPLPPQSSVSANSTISATGIKKAFWQKKGKLHLRLPVYRFETVARNGLGRPWFIPGPLRQ